MAKLDLSIYGITDVKEILHNPSYEELYKAETDPKLEGYEKGYLTELGAVNVMTGIYTGRSPKDKFFVKNEASEDSVWWTSDEYKNDNKPCSEEAWADLKAKAVKQLSGKKLYRNPPESSFHHGSGMASSLREKYVHPSDRRRTSELRGTGFRFFQRCQS